MGKQTSDEIEIDIVRIIIALKRKCIIIGLVAVCLGLAAVYYSMMKQSVTYVTTSKMYVANNSEVDPFYTTDEIESANRLLCDFAELVKSRMILEEVLSELCLDEMNYRELSSCINVKNPEDTRIIEVSVYGGDPKLIKEIVDEVVYISTKRIPSILRIPQPKVLEDGSEPYLIPGKSKKLFGVLGAGVGIFLGMTIVILLEILDSRVKGINQLKRNFDGNVLGVIPYRRKKILALIRERMKRKHD